MAQEDKLSVFEIVLTGYDGSSDATDDKIVWVNALNKDQVLNLLKQMQVSYISVERIDVDTFAPGIDFTINQTGNRTYK